MLFFLFIFKTVDILYKHVLNKENYFSRLFVIPEVFEHVSSLISVFIVSFYQKLLRTENWAKMIIWMKLNLFKVLADLTPLVEPVYGLIELFGHCTHLVSRYFSKVIFCIENCSLLCWRIAWTIQCKAQEQDRKKCKTVFFSDTLSAQLTFHVRVLQENWGNDRKRQINNFSTRVFESDCFNCYFKVICYRRMKSGMLNIRFTFPSYWWF